MLVRADGVRIQSVELGTGPGGSVRARQTSSGFVLSGRGDEIEFTREVDESDYSQFSVMRRNIRLVTVSLIIPHNRRDLHAAMS